MKLFGIAAILAVVVAVLLFISSLLSQKQSAMISSFDECAAAGNPIMPARTTDGVQSGGESFPEQCRTPDGRTFVNPRQRVEPPLSTPPGAAGCVVGGCSQELCTDASAEPMASICMYRAEFACYKSAVCERQVDGKCGWTQTPELKRCLANPPAVEAGVEVVY